MRKLFLFFVVIFLLSGCSGKTETNINNEDVDSDIEVNESVDSSTSTDSTDDSYEYKSNSGSPYTKEELENDPSAPSTNPNDYNADGEYVPEGGISDNPADYNADGEYKPIEDMTQEEKEAELIEMFENNFGQ
ncbi:lipoprotein [Metabacillus fastidiosus]|uniref:hypothetical protein n=1 Tax=Metabacillus fastidiosus TaxID=1458 RepID=UPI003D29E168